MLPNLKLTCFCFCFFDAVHGFLINQWIKLSWRMKIQILKETTTIVKNPYAFKLLLNHFEFEEKKKPKENLHTATTSITRPCSCNKNYVSFFSFSCSFSFSVLFFSFQIRLCFFLFFSNCNILYLHFFVLAIL